MIKALDLFCGGGGSSVGANQAGVSIACGIDLNGIATATYKDNFPSAHVITSKLEDVSPAKLRTAIGEVQLLLASPECTNHTCARGAAPRSEESRATAMQALRYAKVFKPRWIVLENVVHMRPWARYKELKRSLVDLGYNVEEYVLDAADFGVPQNRKRLFIVCDKKKPPAIISANRACTKIKKVSDVLDDSSIWRKSFLYDPKRAKPTLERAERAFKELGPQASFLVVYYGTDGGGGWQRLDRPLRTVTTIDRFALVQPSNDGPTIRMLQVSELKRAMGLDDEYKMNQGTRRDKIRLLGNGVCPPVMKHIVGSLAAE